MYHHDVSALEKTLGIRLIGYSMRFKCDDHEMTSREMAEML